MFCVYFRKYRRWYLVGMCWCDMIVALFVFYCKCIYNCIDEWKELESACFLLVYPRYKDTPHKVHSPEYHRKWKRIRIIISEAYIEKECTYVGFPRKNNIKYTNSLHKWTFNNHRSGWEIPRQNRSELSTI